MVWMSVATDKNYEIENDNENLSISLICFFLTFEYKKQFENTQRQNLASFFLEKKIQRNKTLAAFYYKENFVDEIH